MALKIQLAVGESVLIGKARVANGGNARCVLVVTGDEKILRGGLIMLEEEATTPVKRLYFTVQGIYLADSEDELFPLYHELSRTVTITYPFMNLAICDISMLILSGQYFEALIKTHDLIKAEQDFLEASTPKEETA
jgi:flagellar biosynthesis repressor protein FlbT